MNPTKEYITITLIILFIAFIRYVVDVLYLSYFI